MLSEDTINEMKQMLMKTTGVKHYNGWNNRTTFGYHSFDLMNFKVNGQRNPLERLAIMKEHVDFDGKTIIDFGCNSGGMLFHLPEISRGFGLDFNMECIKSAQCFKDKLNMNHLHFHKQDLNTFNLSDFKNQNKIPVIDIVFLLALGSWIKNWEQLYTDSLAYAETIVLETNNDTEGIPQLELFRSLNATVTLISDASLDDTTLNHGRKTYIIRK